MLEYQDQHTQIASSQILPHMANLQFWLIVGLGEGLLIAAALPLLLIYCIYYHDGLIWDDSTLFNFHPFAMVLGLIILYSQGVLVYRVLPVSKIFAKCLHAFIHLIVAGCMVVGYYAIVRTKQRAGNTHLFSLHSWLGVTTGGLFAIQLFVGLTAYLIPATPISTRAFLMPFHRFGGMAILALSVVTCICGFQENIVLKGLGKHNCKKYIVVDGTRQCHTQWSYFTKAPEGMVLNSLGIAICLAAAVIAFIVTRTGWRRKAHGSENVQLLVSDRL